ncbi:MAG: DUF2793 domain-containing protein [Alphaproteobacteria bacterium]|nr:DUF2793 domain-containing protein [Alphaproteobacteria bacterium]
MTVTPHLAMTYIASSQAQKEITHNEALNDIDFLAKASVINTTVSTPPSDPGTGDSYIIAASPSGAWTGFAGSIAGYYGGWSIKTPKAGWTVWAQNSNRLLYFSGSAWELLATPQVDGTLSWTPGTVAAGSGVSSAAVTVSGAALGDLALVAAPYNLQGLQATAYVSAPNTAIIRLSNSTGAGVSLASGTWRVRIVKA